MTSIAIGGTTAAAEILETVGNYIILRVAVMSLYTMTCGGAQDVMVVVVVTDSSHPPYYRGLLRMAVQQSLQQRSRLREQAQTVLLGAGGGIHPTSVELCLGVCQ
jgi:hypothetical protein